MSTQLPHHRSRHWMATGMAARLGRLAAVLAAVMSGLLASAVAATAAFANPIPVGDADTSPITAVPRVISVGGMAGWQIALIAIGAALVAAAVAVLADRKLTTRSGAATTA